VKLPDPSLLLKPVDPALLHRRPLSLDDAVRLRYLGTAGFELVQLRGEERVLVLDPFLTRPGLLETATRPLVPNAELIAEVLPRADDVLVGHAHHDHVLDAPELCRRTGARLIGSPATINVGRAAGLPESQLVLTTGRERLRSGDAIVEGLPSRHGRVYFNRVTLPGDITEPPPWPPRFRDLRHGLVLNWYVELGGVRIVHVDSADFIDEELAGHACDVLCLCAIGRAYRRGYTQSIVRLLKPRWVVACHWDYFFTPYRGEQRCLPGVDLPGFCDEIRAAGAEPIVLPFDGELGVRPR
jgi:L-ascorbate metabolism protein UlaG (beta-lactamase superfamily)